MPVGYCTTSKVDPQLGLHYVGEAIGTIAEREPTDVIHLLLYKSWPANDAASDAFASELKRRQQVHPKVFESFKALPKKGHPMKWFLHGLNVLGMTGATGDFQEDTLDLIAQIPVMVAAIFRIREEWGEPIAPRDDLDYMANFVNMLGIPHFSDEQNASPLMRVFDVLHLDHGGGNLHLYR